LLHPSARRTVEAITEGGARHFISRIVLKDHSRPVHVIVRVHKLWMFVGEMINCTDQTLTVDLRPIARPNSCEVSQDPAETNEWCPLLDI
jgi:hypothetical protein